MKGQFMSLMVVFMLIPLMFLTFQYSESLGEYGEEIASIVSVKSGYYYFDTVDDDLLRAGEIIGKRSLITADNYVIENGEGLNSSKEVLKELFINGTIYGNESLLMENSTIGEWLNRTEKISEGRGFLLNLTLENLTVGMENSFEVFFTLDYELRMKNRAGTFSFEKNITKNATVQIKGLEDPLFPLNTNGMAKVIVNETRENLTGKLVTGNGNNSFASGESIKVPAENVDGISNKGEKILVLRNRSGLGLNDLDDFKGVVIENDTDLSGFSKPYVEGADGAWDIIPNRTRILVDGDEEEVWDIQGLYEAWEKQYYISGQGPSFLKRLEGNLTPSENGLDVLVRKDELSSLGLDVKDKSSVAHIYFSDDNPQDFGVKGLPEEVRIDNKTDITKTNLEIFGVNNSLSV